MIIDHVSNRQFTFREMLTVGVTKSPPDCFNAATEEEVIVDRFSAGSS